MLQRQLEQVNLIQFNGGTIKRLVQHTIIIMQDIQITLEEFKSKYEIKQVIGKGKFGSINLIWNREENTHRALKTIYCTNKKQQTYVMQEIQIQYLMKHQHIVKIFKFYKKKYEESLDKKDHCCFGIILELGHFSILQLLKSPSKQPYTLEQLSFFIVRFINLCGHLQSQEIVHRDIKPANIIIFGAALDFKLTDFGIACFAKHRPKGYAGTQHYSSPLLKKYLQASEKGKKYQQHKSDPYKDDVYSLGVTLREMLDRIRVKEMNNQCELFIQVQGIIHKMLRERQQQRPDFFQLMQDNFVKRRAKRPDSMPTKKKQIELMSSYQQKLFSYQNTIKKQMEFYEGQQQQDLFKFTYQTIKTQKYQVRTLCRINSRYLFAGCEQGQLIVINTQNGYISNLSLRHSRYVVRVQKDEKNKLWSISGDGCLFVIQIDSLLQLIRIQQERPICVKYSKSIFGKKIKQEFRNVTLDPNLFNVLDFKPVQRKICVSYFQVYDETRYIVAYTDGSALIHWLGRQKKINVFYGDQALIIKFKIFEEKIYFCSQKSLIKVFNINTFLEQYDLLQFHDQVVDFTVYPKKNSDKFKIQALTIKNRIQTMEVSEKHQLYTFNEQVRPKNTTGCIFLSHSHYLIMTEDGKIWLKSEQIKQLDLKKGWISLEQSRQNELVACSIQRQVLIISMKNKPK